MICLESHSRDPYFNLALEEFIFEKLNRDESYFMLWQNDNTIVVGNFQNTPEEVNQEFVEKHGIRVARRLSGGGAVYHDTGNLNFTFVVHQADLESFNFKFFVLPVIRVLEQMGIHAEFNGRNDITIEGCKISGNSQFIRGKRILHHGCIMLDSNLANVAGALRPKDAKFESKSVKSIRSRVTTINAHAPSPVSMEQFKGMLNSAVSRDNPLTPMELSKEQLEEVRRLRDEKYSTWEWNYGKSPEYNLKRERKFQAGLVTAYLQVANNRVKSIRFFGDFFGSGQLQELESSMESLPLDTGLTASLQKLNIGHYMNGITAQDIYQLLMYD